MASRGSRSSKGTTTAGKPRATSLKGHSGTPGQKVAAKPNTLVTGKSASTGH